MGNVLGIPLYYLKKTFASNSEESSSTRRLDIYNFDTDDFTNLKGLEAVNFAVPREETALEHRRSELKACDVDSIFFCGFNSKKETLVVKISINRQGLATAWVFFRLKTGETYSLPGEMLYRVPIRTGPDTFTAGGLRIRCLHAMRKWRISFSGLLKDIETDDESPNLVYIKFSFIWTASSFVYDMKSDIPLKNYCKYVVEESSTTREFHINFHLSGRLDSYIQGGTMMGTYQLDGEAEQEMHLWGSRKRTFEPTTTGESHTESEYFANMQEGDGIYFGSLGIPSSSNNRLHHGFIVLGNSLGGPVDECDISVADDGDKINFERGEFSWNATFASPEVHLNSRNVDRSSCDLFLCPVTLDDQKGRGVIITTSWYPDPSSFDAPKIYLKDINPGSISWSSYVLGLRGNSCRESSLTGGKGSSLADLHVLSSIEGEFFVPRGVVVTTTAYEAFLKASPLEKHISALEREAWRNFPFDLEKECERVSEVISQTVLPVSIQNEIRNALLEEFGTNLEDISLAVRSSASGEDSEELSAAGQMKTFLGVNGITKVFEAVVKCWASQFEYTAIQYKRQNGQLLNSPMAVVIQEMVSADVAGVMFTCDPVSGNPATITITSNYGIGESVVSASVEPDTIIVIRDADGETEVDDIRIGAKKNKVILTENGVIEEDIPQDYSLLCSLSRETAKKLADLGILIEEAYGCLMDIEWAIKDNQVYMLQARPVTTFDKETEFELIHECDSPLRSENEWYTIANLGEVFPGAMTQLGLTSYNKGFEFVITSTILKRSKDTMPWSPYYQSGMNYYANHLMFSSLDMMRFYHGKHTMLSMSQNLAMFGRILDDPELLARAVRRNKYFPTVFIPLQVYYILSDLFNASSRLQRRRLMFPVGTRLEIPTTHTAEEIYFIICRQWIELREIMSSHFECTIFSMFSSLAVIQLLMGKSEEINEDILGDFAQILGNCSEVESAEVPNAVESVAREILKTKDASGFHEMDPREALMWLERTDSSPKKEFDKLLKNHGHRCIQEFDLRSKPWGSDPIPLIKTIQEIVAKGHLKERKRVPESISETIKTLKTLPSWRKRLILKIIIPFSRKAVALREGSKSLLIRVVSCMRHSYRRLAEQMVAEGRIPSTELIFFFTHFELLTLLQTRSPKLIQKAIRRKVLYPSINSMIFPETSIGIPKPINFAKKEPVPKGSFTMTGVPVSQGSAIGLARVATTLQEASELQAGEILIAFSTDIGWSPYFPMLGGVATELGGLVSHGAVIAREYGLPCVVGVHGATLKFNTGDKVFIDGTKGILTRLED